jgi:hypothetical protein
LGFSWDKLSDFRNPNDSYSFLTEVFAYETIQLGSEERTVTKIVTPNVLRIAKEHFNCSSGVELENGGGNGTQGSHWEKRILNNEYMTGTASNNPKISKFTLALLQDSGWYNVNYDKADTFIWGKSQGCKFINNSCVDWTEKNGGCHVKAHASCSYDYTAKAECTLRTGLELPAEYQYYSDTSKYRPKNSFSDFPGVDICLFPIIARFIILIATEIAE